MESYLPFRGAKRTLTIFEAVYLNSSLFQEIFTLNPEGTYNESYPTLEQRKHFSKRLSTS